ncbi:MAG: Tex family protein [Pseudomonadota bacterium]
MDIKKQLSDEFSVNLNSVENVLSLLDADSTIPFIARYRKEATGSMDEIVLRKIDERYKYFNELIARKETVLKTILEQGKLTDELKSKIEVCLDKRKLEDLYLPYKPKKKTRATAAKEKGLEPFLKWILEAQNETSNILEEAKKYINEEKKVLTTDDAIKGASDIYAEMVAEKAEHREFVRNYFFEKGIFVSKVKKDFEEKETKYKMYYDYQMPVKNVASHNMLALFRAEKEKVIIFKVDIDLEKLVNYLIKEEFAIYGNAHASFKKAAIEDAYDRLMRLSLEAEVRIQKRREADLEAIKTFATNLQNLLLSAPAGNYPVIAIDPGFRTGCKVTCLDATGKYLEYKAIFPNEPQKRFEESRNTLFDFIKKYKPKFIAIGNGTASRETESFVKKAMQDLSSGLEKPNVVIVNESGASVYSASETAIKEFPDLDVTVRGAISIGRRLMDPLSELVKIDPKSIGVGQYQHDVDQTLLKDKLKQVVESCVNNVGVELNRASAEVLSYISGINAQIALNILDYRNKNGKFKSRKELLKVPRLGPKAYEQAAGFLTILEAKNPLDNSRVHPESYYVVEKMAKELSIEIKEIINNAKVIDSLDVETFTDNKTGKLTIYDIFQELKKPGLDPREEFEYASFSDDVMEIEDLSVGMVLNGVVTNVTKFGAFVDIGVHQDGLIHISNIANHFIKDPAEVLSVGQKVKVKVLEVDKKLKRISLSRKELLAWQAQHNLVKPERLEKQNEKALNNKANLNDLLNKYSKR